MDFMDDEDYDTTNHVIDIKNGEYLRGQIDKGILGKEQRTYSTYFNDFGNMESADFIITFNLLLLNI